MNFNKMFKKSSLDVQILESVEDNLKNLGKHKIGWNSISQVLS